jgi:hypothetical protein
MIYFKGFNILLNVFLMCNFRLKYFCSIYKNVGHFQNTPSGHTVCSPAIDPRPIPNEHWNPGKHTIPLPTDAYGCIDFRGTHTNKAQYIRYE